MQAVEHYPGLTGFEAITPEKRAEFLEQGILLVRDALSEEHRARKVAYVLSDLSRTGRGATKVIPGSHLSNTLARTADGEDPRGTVEITANPGDSFIFDRRLWHSRSVNRSAVTRKILFVGYTYRWIRPLDDMPIDRDGDWWRNRTPVQRQLLGEATHTANHWGVDWDGYIDEKIPLRHELQTRGQLDRSIPWLR